MKYYYLEKGETEEENNELKSKYIFLTFQKAFKKVRTDKGFVLTEIIVIKSIKRGGGRDKNDK